MGGQSLAVAQVGAPHQATVRLACRVVLLGRDLGGEQVHDDRRRRRAAPCVDPRQPLDQGRRLAALEVLQAHGGEDAEGPVDVVDGQALLDTRPELTLIEQPLSGASAGIDDGGRVLGGELVAQQVGEEVVVPVPVVVCVTKGSQQALPHKRAHHGRVVVATGDRVSQSSGVSHSSTEVRSRNRRIDGSRVRSTSPVR